MAARPYLTRRQSMMAAVEGTPGTYELSAQVDLEPYDLVKNENIENIQRVPHIGAMSQNIGWIGGAFPSFTFRSQLRGHSSGAGFAPLEGMLYRAAGMDQVIVPATSVTYSFSNASDTYTTLSVRFWYEADGAESKYFIGVGCIAKWRILITPTQVIFIEWDLQGKFYEITAMTDYYGQAARPAFDSTVLQPKSPKGKACSYRIAPLGANYYPVGDFMIDSGIEFTDRPGLEPQHGYEIPWIGERNSNGSMTIEEEREATYDFRALIFGETVTPVDVQVTDSAANVIDIAADVRFTGVDEAKDLRVLSAYPFECGSHDNSDIVITIT